MSPRKKNDQELGHIEEQENKTEKKVEASTKKSPKPKAQAKAKNLDLNQESQATISVKPDAKNSPKKAENMQAKKPRLPKEAKDTNKTELTQVSQNQATSAPKAKLASKPLESAGESLTQPEPETKTKAKTSKAKTKKVLEESILVTESLIHSKPELEPELVLDPKASKANLASSGKSKAVKKESPKEQDTSLVLNLDENSESPAKAQISTSENQQEQSKAKAKRSRNRRKKNPKDLANVNSIENPLDSEKLEFAVQTESEDSEQDFDFTTENELDKEQEPADLESHESKNKVLSRSARRRRAKRIKKLALASEETAQEVLSITARDAESLPAIIDDAVLSLAPSKKNKKNKKKPIIISEEIEEGIKGKRRMFISIQPEEQIEFIITDDDVVSEYFVEMQHQQKLRGNIYKAVVSNIDNNLQAAFVNFGGEKNGFLQIDEIHPEYWLCNHTANKNSKYPPINKALRVGQELLVQIVKEPIGNKGAFLTTWISLPGRYIVLTPGQEQIGISRKVEDQAERQRLKDLFGGLVPGENLGVILRTACIGASKTNIQKDLQFLKRLWKEILKKTKDEQSPALIYKEADLSYRTLRDYLTDEVCELWLDDDASADAVKETVSLIYPRKSNLVNVHTDPRQSMNERFNLQRQLEEVFSREVSLKSGGRIVFDQTEALMAIDVNSGKTSGKSGFESMVLKTNLEAAEAIARHLRLRDIGGQIVIDFIEMRDKKHCLEVEKVIRNSMKSDRARYDISKISAFGLMELIRQRTGNSAISISSEPCPHCFGTGVRRNIEWQAQENLREIARRLRSNQGTKHIYETNMELCLYLLNHKKDRLGELENLYQCQLEILPRGIQ